MTRRCREICFRNTCRLPVNVIPTSNLYLWASTGSVELTPGTSIQIIIGSRPTMAQWRSTDLLLQTRTKINDYKVEEVASMVFHRGTHETLNTQTSTIYTARLWSRRATSPIQTACTLISTVKTQVNRHLCTGYRRREQLTSDQIMTTKRRAKSVDLMP